VVTVLQSLLPGEAATEEGADQGGGPIATRI
jgi:hypothetical protein